MDLTRCGLSLQKWLGEMISEKMHGHCCGTAVPDDLFRAGRRVFVAVTWPTASISLALQSIFDPIVLPKGTL